MVLQNIGLKSPQVAVRFLKSDQTEACFRRLFPSTFNIADFVRRISHLVLS